MRISDWSSDVCSSDRRERRFSAGNLPNRGNAGSVVVTDPRNGEVLAMASYPLYDPSDFVNGISSTRWEFLNSNEADKPILNRAIQGVYAPGRSEEHTSELQSLMRISYAVFCLKKKKTNYKHTQMQHTITTQHK